MTVRISTIAIRLKQIDEMLQPMPCCDEAATLRPSAPIAIARGGTNRGTRERSRRDVNQSRSEPTTSVAARASGMFASGMFASGMFASYKFIPSAREPDS